MMMCTAVLFTSMHAKCRTLYPQCPAVTLYTIFWTLNSCTLRPHGVFMSLCGSENKQRLFPYTALTDWFFNRDLTVCSPVVTICTTSLTFNNYTFWPHSAFICFVWIWKQTAIIPYTINNWLLLWQRLNPLYTSGHYMYHQFNIQQFYVMPTQCIYVFCVDLRTNSDYFPIQH